MVAPVLVKYRRIARSLGLVLIIGNRCPSEDDSVPVPQLCVMGWSA